MMAIVGWLLFCIISGAVGVIGGFFVFIAAATGDKSCLIMTAILWLISAGFGYGAYCHTPFKVIML